MKQTNRLKSTKRKSNMEIMKNEIPSYSKDDLLGTRLLVFIEDIAHSNKYRQVLLTKQEFKDVSFSIGTPDGYVDEQGNDGVMIRTSDEIYDLPDLIQIHNEQPTA